MDYEDILKYGTGISVLFLVGIIILLMGFDMVDASHLGIKVNLGTTLGVMEPGIKWTGIFTEVYQYDMRVRKATVEMEGDAYAPDKTGQPIFAKIDVNYKLKPGAVETIYQTVGEDDAIVDKLNIIPIITEGFKRATVKYEALEILDKREEVAHLAEQNIKDRFPAEYFEIESVVISNIHYSMQFQDAIDSKKTAIQLSQVALQNLEKVKFEQQQEIEKYKAQAEQIKLQSAQLTAMTVQRAWIEKWNGALPAYIMTSPENADMILQLPMVK